MVPLACTAAVESSPLRQGFMLVNMLLLVLFISLAFHRITQLLFVRDAAVAAGPGVAESSVF